VIARAEKNTAGCARRSPGDVLKDPGSIPGISTPTPVTRASRTPQAASGPRRLRVSGPAAAHRRGAPPRPHPAAPARCRARYTGYIRQNEITRRILVPGGTRILRVISFCDWCDLWGKIPGRSGSRRDGMGRPGHSVLGDGRAGRRRKETAAITKCDISDIGPVAPVEGSSGPDRGRTEDWARYLAARVAVHYHSALRHGIIGCRIDTVVADRSASAECNPGTAWHHGSLKSRRSRAREAGVECTTRAGGRRLREEGDAAWRR
jgi:hypothetical protein